MPAKIFFHTNIRFLRERKHLSQEELAQRVDISRNKLQALESGRTQNPIAEDLVKFSELFKISIDTLLKVNLPVLGEMKICELEAGNDVYMMGSKIRVLAISVDKENKENAEYVPISAKAGYRSGFTDPEYMASLPKFNIPTLPKHGTFRTFPISGDSMLPVPDKSQVTGRYVENWKDIKPDTFCILILNGIDDFVFKQVTIQKDGSFLLKSLNKLYQPYIVSAGEVLEIWQFCVLHSKELPAQRTDLEELKSLILDIKKQLPTLR